MQYREYETIYIVRPDLAEDALAQVNERLTNTLDKEDAKLLKHDIWGKKKLAFEVKKHPKGVYFFLSFLGKPDCIKELERNLRLLEPVLTYQTIKVAENVDVERRVAEAAKEAEDKARAEEARRKAEAEAIAAASAKEAEAQAEAQAQAAAAAEAVVADNSDDKAPAGETAQVDSPAASQPEE